MSNFVNTVDIVGDEALSASIIDKSITEFADDTVETIGQYAFRACNKLTTADLPATRYISSSAFLDCATFNTLILRGKNLCTLENSNAFTGTPITNASRGHIYVPDSLVSSYKAASGWHVLQGCFRALEDFTVDGTITGKLDVWGAVKKFISDGTYKQYLSVGEVVPVDLGTYGIVNMQIVAFDTDDKADGSGKAPITWISRDVIAKRAMSSANSTQNGWAGSEMRAWLQGDFYNALPDEIKAAIVSVNKTYKSNYSSATGTDTCVDNVWIPSHCEIFGNNNFESSGVKYSSVFTSAATRKKSYNGAGSWWFLRSAHSSVAFRAVDHNGGDNSYSPAASAGVVLGFCT